MATHGDLKKAVVDWMTWFKKFSKELIPRENIPLFQHDLCLALTGVRRSGKTSTAVQIANELGKTDSTFYFNFEDPVFFSGTDVKSIDILLSLFEEQTGIIPTLVILDEVQNVQSWERWVRKAIDIGIYQVIVTGSSSELLSSEIATAISGRVIEHTIWPLSFSEYLSFIQSQPLTEVAWQRELENYFRWGGFPKPVLIQNENERIMLLKQYLSDIVLRDVISRHSIKNQHALNQIVTFYLSGMSCLSSYNALRKAFGISVELASVLTHYLTQAFLVFEMGRYHPNLKVQARDAKKIYAIDTGLRTVSLVSERSDWGRLAENIVYIELRRRLKTVYYFKEEKEVDFVITELGRPIEAIQVTYSNLEQSDTKEREVSALLECLKNLGLKKGTILTKTYDHKEHIQGFDIEYMPLYLWLK
ncbi:MAG: ATP-binding protein [Candidatus Protochlamydia sp.]|nr:ATP-binding protein [Candidatus Protochlamydia sp.]